MLTRWNTGWREFDEMFSAMNQLRQQVEGTFDGDPAGAGQRGLWAPAGYPRSNLADLGSSLALTAEVPGFSDKDIQLTLNQDVLSISGERKIDPPAGYSAHRQERRALKFARSFALPCRVDPERVSATVKNGILTVTLEKAPEARPRQIKIGAT